MKRVIKPADRKIVINKPHIFHLSKHFCTECSVYEQKGVLECTAP